MSSPLVVALVSQQHQTLFQILLQFNTQSLSTLTNSARVSSIQRIASQIYYLVMSLLGGPYTPEDYGSLSEHGILIPYCAGDPLTSSPVSYIYSDIMVVELPYFQNGPGFACSVSANHSYILGQCCNINGTSYRYYASDAEIPGFGVCDYAYGTMPNNVAEDEFMTCFNDTKASALGAKAKRFVSLLQPSSEGGNVEGLEVRFGVWNFGLVVWMLRFCKELL